MFYLFLWKILHRVLIPLKSHIKLEHILTLVISPTLTSINMYDLEFYCKAKMDEDEKIYQLRRSQRDTKIDNIIIS